MASPQKRQRHDSADELASENEMVANVNSDVPFDAIRLFALQQLELRLQHENDRRVAAEHELFNFGESLRRLEVVMRTQEKHIHSLTVQLRDSRLANQRPTERSPINEHRAACSASTEKASSTENRPCSQPECGRRRRLLRAIREKVTEYSAIIEEKRSKVEASKKSERKRKGKKRVSMETTMDGKETKKENDRLRQENQAYEEYIEFVHQTYRQHFVESPIE